MQDIKIEDIGLSVRTYNCLKKKGINFSSEIMSLFYEDLCRIKGMGKKSIEEIVNFQKEYTKLTMTDNLLVDNFEKFDCRSSINTKYIDLNNYVLYSIFPNLRYDENFLILFITKETKVVYDYPITLDYFSVRTFNCLKSNKINSIKDLIYFDSNKLINFKHLGSKSYNEIFKVLKNHLAYKLLPKLLFEKLSNSLECILDKFEDDISLLGKNFHIAINNAFINLVNENKYNINLESSELEKIITNDILSSNIMIEWSINYLNNLINRNKIISKDKLINSLPDWMTETNLANNALNFLIQNKKIELIEGKFRLRLPHLSEWIETLSNYDITLLTMRLNGKTLQECGNYFGFTRERARQKLEAILEKKPLLNEDYYLYWFSKYNLTYDFCSYVFDMNLQSYNYLTSVCEKGKIDFSNILTDEHLDGILYPRIKRFLHKDLIFIKDEYLPYNKTKIALKLAKLYFKERDGYAPDFYKIYEDFLKSNNLSNNKKLIFSNEKAFETRLFNSSSILSKYGRRFRYYSIGEYDINELIESLHFDLYKDIEISTKKIINDYPDVIEAYDIQDEYELHNLLKKTEKKWNLNNKYDISIQRMPFITFGNANRAKQAEDLLYQVAPVTAEEFGQYYEMEYGVKANTAIANIGILINQYYHNGFYTIDQNLLDEYEFTYMGNILTEDFYFIDDVKLLYPEFTI